MNRVLYILAFFIILLPTKTWAELSQGIENDACFKKNNNDYHKAHDCLSAMKDESEGRLEKLIQATNDLIVKNNDVPVFQSDDPNLTISNVYSKHFLASQKDWQKYKKNLCLGVASEVGTGTYDYQASIDQCEINLNKRHMEEIKMMGITP